MTASRSGDPACAVDCRGGSAAPRSNDCKLLIKYEDLRLNTYKTLKQIYQFLKIKIENDELKKIITKYSYENIPETNKGKGKFVRTAEPGTWKKNLTSEEKIIMEKIMLESLKTLGYE